MEISRDGRDPHAIKYDLSKSQFIRGLQCHKSLWLYRNRPELRTPPDENQQSIFDSGTDVGLLARRLFPSGTAVEFEGSSLNEKIHETKVLINSGARTIYEATFAFDGALAMADILHKGVDGWELYEVKSSTAVKDVHINDLTFQYCLLRGSGLNISKSCLIHLNREYVRSVELEVSKLFTVVDLTSDVQNNLEHVVSEVGRINSMLQSDCPEVQIGAQCENPYPCDFIDHCWAHIPENSIFDLRGRGVDKLAYYSRGIVKFSDLDLDELNGKQRMQVEAELKGIEFLDRDGIKEFLNSLFYPIYFLDFETFHSPIPPFNGTRPYEQIPFQFSLHWQEKEDGELSHYGFLAKEGSDQRDELVRNLAIHIPDKACVVTYNMRFEKGVIRNLSEKFPLYADRLMGIHDSIVDLMIPFYKRAYYIREMKGSYSLKAVLPALIPELTYKGLNISNAGQAEASYSTLHLLTDKEEVEKIRVSLLEYCKLDTFALVKLIEKLKALCR